MKFKISQGMIDTAMKADQRIMSYYKKGGNYTKLERERRFYYGTLGELCFVLALAYLASKRFTRPNGMARRIAAMC